MIHSLSFLLPIAFPKKKSTSFLILLGLWLFLAVFAALPAQAQLTPAADTSVAEAVVPDWTADTLGRRTPRGAVQGFISAIAEENYDKAALYLNLDSTLQQKQDGAKLAHALQRLLDQSGEIIPYSLLNDTYDGREDDNLGPNLERIGSAKANGEEFDLFLEMLEDKEGGPIWLVSSQTIQRIPEVIEETGKPLANKVLPEFAIDTKWNGVPVGQWFFLLLIAALAYAGSWVLIKVVVFILRRSWRRSHEEHIEAIIHAFTLPIQLYLALWLFISTTQRVGISIIVRQQFSQLTVLLGLMVFLLLLWRLIEVMSQYLQRRLTRKRNQAALSAVLFLRRGAKISIIIFGIIAFLGMRWAITTGSCWCKAKTRKPTKLSSGTTRIPLILRPWTITTKMGLKPTGPSATSVPTPPCTPGKISPRRGVPTWT